jgi:hypothetical protein
MMQALTADIKEEMHIMAFKMDIKLSIEED